MKSILSTILALALPCVASLAQSEAGGESPETRAVRLETLPTLDGEVLSDPAWRGLVPATGFWQVVPEDGEPASERTEVFIGFSDDTFYVGVVCYDSQPEDILFSDRRRDASLDDSDSFQVILDTFLDRQGGFVFGTNPAGAEYDGQVTKEGSGGFGSGGGGFNLEWNGSWRVQSKVSEMGWSAEMAIPFRTLRYGREQVQTWGVNFQRTIRRRNERAFWAQLPRQFGLHRLSLAGTLVGVEVPPQRNLKLMPYVLGSAVEESREADRETDAEIGFDLKYSITPSLTLDATYNTDFAQVEADEIQINLDRFRLFFPEKRPFFLENAGQFSVGVPQEIELFFSRRIGIGPSGEEIPIEGGLRLSGKIGSSTNIGLLRMRTEDVHGVTPENDFSVLRINQELPNRSSIGAIYVEREGLGDDSNRTYAIDGTWGIGDYAQLVAFAASTDTPGIEADEYAYRIGGSYDSAKWSSSANVSEVTAGFNPEVGFLARSDYRKLDFFVLRRYRPEDLWGLLELRPHVSYQGYWKPDDFHETGRWHIDNHWEWTSGFEVHTGVNLTHEGVREDFEISDGVIVPAGQYDHAEAALVLLTNPGAPLAFSARVTIGGFFGGDRVNLVPELRYRYGETLTAELNWNHNSIDLPGASFDTDLGRLRMTYSFSPKISLQALLQYNSRTESFATNLRFAWLQAANAGFYIVYNEVREDLPGETERGRELIVKFSRIFDLLR